MNIVKALAIVNDCERIKSMAGLLARYPYNAEQMVEAATVIKQELEGELVRIKGDLQIAEARLRASNARFAKTEKASG